MDSDSFSESVEDKEETPVQNENDNLEVIKEINEEKEENEKISEQRISSEKKLSTDLMVSKKNPKKSFDISLDNKNNPTNVMLLDPLNIQSLKKDRKKSYFTPNQIHNNPFKRKSHQLVKKDFFIFSHFFLLE